MIKFLVKTLITILVIALSYFAEGVRTGELVKFSRKGVLFKTWEGEISHGVSEAQRFEFSVEDSEEQVIKDLKELQGRAVKLHYFERYANFFWLGDTKYFITKVEEDKKLNLKY